MNPIIFLCGVLAVGSAQFSQAIDAVAKPWTGPFANHVPGQVVPDTPEVAAVKAQHAKAHAQVLAVLPALPDEIRYQQDDDIVTPVQRQPQQTAHINNPISVPVAQPQPIHTSPQFTQFAEAIPRSPIGEVPEVHAARVAHLAALVKAKNALPALVGAPQEAMRFLPTFGQHIQDTAEVAAAKAAHAAAVAAARNFGK